MPYVVALVSDRPSLEELCQDLAGLSDVELDDIGPWSDITSALNAPVNPEHPNLAQVVMTVVMENQNGITNLARALVARSEEYLLLDASTGAPLGRLTPPEAQDNAERLLRSAQVVD